MILTTKLEQARENRKDGGGVLVVFSRLDPWLFPFLFFPFFPFFSVFSASRSEHVQEKELPIYENSLML
jgi:hypothetical protein